MRQAFYNAGRDEALAEVVAEITRRLDEVRSDLRHGTTPFNHARRDTLESLLEWVQTHE